MSIQGNPSITDASYDYYKEDIIKINAVCEGSKTAKNYLEPFVNEVEDSLTYRLENITLLNYTRRAVDSSSNMILRKDVRFIGTPQPDEEKAVNDLIKEVTKLVVREGHCYVVTDSPSISGTTKAEEQALGIKPYQYPVSRLQVPNSSKDDKGNYIHLTINETYQEQKGFIQVTEQQQRIFYDDGTVEIYRGNELYDTIETGTNYVPVVKVGIEDLFITDLAKINLNHMNTRSALNRYLRIAATPVPVIWGLEDDTKEITVGVDSALVFRNLENSDFQWREMTGSSTDLLQSDLQKMETDMSNSLISIISGNNVAFNEAQISSENFEGYSFLSNISSLVEEGVNQSLLQYQDMGGSQFLIEIPQDYDATKLTPEQQSQYMLLYQNAVISLDTYLKVLIEGEVLPELDTDEEVAKVISGN